MGEEESDKNIKTKKIDTVQQGSEGVETAFPDVCETPSPAGPIPIPYPNRHHGFSNLLWEKTCLLS